MKTNFRLRYLEILKEKEIKRHKFKLKQIEESIKKEKEWTRK